MGYVARGLFWAGIYLALVLLPLAVLLFGPVPGGMGVWYDLAVFLGFAGTSMMAAMFFLTARFKRAAMPFGIDIVYYFHRQIALVCFVFVVLHPLILIIDEPDVMGMLALPGAAGYMLAGLGSSLALAALMAISLWRKQLRIHYDAWRVWHLFLSVAALLLVIIHIDGVGGYIATPVKQSLWTMMVASWLLLVVYVRIIKPFLILKVPYRIARIIQEKGDTRTLVLQPDGHPGMTFRPGQFAWLSLWSSPFAMREHPFSISSSAAAPEGELHFTIKELGDFTRRMKDAQPGQIAYVDGPYGSFSIDRHPGERFAFFAGGIGIAPIMSMLRTLADRGDRRPILLFYAYRSMERLTFYEEIEALRDRLNLEVVYILKHPPDGWPGERGRISFEMIERHFPQDISGLETFVCGPVPMIRLVEKTLHRIGVPLSAIHSELFDLV